MTEDLLVVGKSLARVDAWEKAQGRALYAGDMKVPGLIYGKVLRSPWPHAIIKHVEAAKARRVPGVRLVISGDDIPRHKFGPIVPDETILACDKVRFAGEEVAAVAASSEEAAEEALGLIEVQYEELPPVFTPEEALLPGAPKVHDSGNVVFPIQWERGDPDLAFQEADHVFEDRYTTSPVYHASVEPQVCLAAPSGAGGVTIWLPMQDPFMGRRYLAQGLGLEEARVRVIQTTVGGAFGGKRAQRLYVICCLLAMRTGAPVRMLNSRQEDFRSTLVRVPMAIELKTAVNRDGTLLAQEKRILADNGAYCKRAPGVMMAASLTMDNLYRWRSVRTRAQLVYTNKIPTGDFRGFGVPQVAFAVESQMDAIADRLGMDPVDLRLKNATRQGDTTVHGWVVNSCGLDECIKKATEAVGWSGRKRLLGSGKGLGLACSIHVSGAATAGYDGSYARVTIGTDGKATLVCGEGEIGQGASTVLSQIAAEELGLSLADVTITGVDTDSSPFSLGAWATRVTTVAGNAVRQAASEARKKLLEEASEVLEARAEDLETVSGRVQVRGVPAKGTTYGEVARRALFRKGGDAIVGEGVFQTGISQPSPAAGFYGNFSIAYGFAAQAAEVEVDRETGNVNLTRLACAHDVGKAINPMSVEGQIEGGVVQGIGYALGEEVLWENGDVANATLGDYRTPTSVDVPLLPVSLVESPDPRGPFGAKGIGEPTIVPTAPAIANAVCNAVGVRIKDLPLTPQKVLSAIRRREGEETASPGE